MLEKEIQFPPEFCFVERQATSDRVEFECFGGRGLNASNDLDCLLKQTFLLVVGNFFKHLAQLPAAQILLHDYSSAAVNLINLRNRQITFGKQSRDVQIRMDRRIERLGIDGSNRGPLLP